MFLSSVALGRRMVVEIIGLAGLFVLDVEV